MLYFPLYLPPLYDDFFLFKTDKDPRPKLQPSANWLGLVVLTTKDQGLIPGQRVKIFLQAIAHCCVCVSCVCPKLKGIRTYHPKYTLGWHIGILICVCVSCLTLFDPMDLLIIFRWRQLIFRWRQPRNNRCRKGSLTSPFYLKAGHKFSMKKMSFLHQEEKNILVNRDRKLTPSWVWVCTNLTNITFNFH